MIISLKSQLIFNNFLLKCQERKEVVGWTRTNIITYSVFSTIEVPPHIIGRGTWIRTKIDGFGDREPTFSRLPYNVAPGRIRTYD